jgi:hypothetical protein
MRQEALAVGAVGSGLALVLVGEERQGGRHIQDGLRERGLEQEAHVRQTERQAGHRGPGHVVWQRLSRCLLCGSPPLLLAALPGGKERGRQQGWG